MKKALFLCLSLLLLVAAQLQAAPATVNFTSERGIPFDLRFDGRPLTRGGARQVHIDRIAPGVHWAEFAIPTPSGRFINYRTRVFLDPGLETSYVLLTRPGCAPQLRKVAAVPMRGGYDRGYGGYSNDGPRGGQEGYHNNHHDNNEDYYDEGPYGNQPSANPNGRSDNSRNGYPSDDTNDDNNGYYPGGGVNHRNPMSPREVDGLVAAVHRQSFDKEKLAMARQAMV